jgi:Domain of unknown function (DUF4124)
MKPLPSWMPMSHPLRALMLTTLTLVLAAPLAQAQQWMWRDKEGRVTASDRPPPRDIAEKDILQRPVPESRRVASPAPAASAASGAAAVAAAAPTALEREVQARKKAAEAEQAAKAKADEERNAARRAENCRNARANLATLESGVRIQRTNDKGEREILEDAARNEEMRRAREAIASECR